ncbi:ribonuclease D [Paraglaciecola chathamensis]|uniref:ribonuclease D n=1 Tax=Paraglaciecola chathamensis TaxID=368405 RepID=UPI0027070B49|nr:ribonuclease D [Paraglaciecola chathamensis]MDO6839768.1 ribonuclease D [Paraglaciecola chathamensis]
MQYISITTNETLNAYCAQLAKAEAIAVDTEFVRTRTLYPKLGLIQIYDGQQIALIDPLEISDFSALKAILTDENIVKVLHSCSEDIETFICALDIVPKPIFDSQFAAAIVGMGASLGYAKLVEVMLDIQVDKGESRTDWLARPLSPEQCRYAAYDVLYLYQLYPTLRNKARTQGRQAWVFGEMDNLSRKKLSQIPYELLYLNIKNNWHVKGKSLYVLQQLAAWRAKEAQQRDLALNFVVRETNLVEVAKKLPTSKNALHQISGLTPQEIRINGQAMLDIVAAAEQVDAAQYPQPVERLVDFSRFKKVAAAVRQVCLQTAEKLDVPVELIGSKKQINQLIKWSWFNEDDTRAQGLLPDLLEGWRGEHLRDALSNVDGLNIVAATNVGESTDA